MERREKRENDGGRGGWIPVIKQRGRQVRPNLWTDGRRAALITLFVDNLPESFSFRNLYDLFIKFGVVLDVYIPQKRRKSTNTRFGFVRYNCFVAATVAEQKANGLWVDNKSLSVKIAEYGKGIENRQRQKQSLTRQVEIRDDAAMVTKQIWHQRTDGQTFAEVIKGAEPRSTPPITIKVDELGNGWLYESLIMRLKIDYSVLNVQNELIKRRVQNVLVRVGGGRDVIISFNSKDDMLSHMSQLKDWFHDWCEYITKWRPGMFLHQERYVWISCYGVPLNLWNLDTFQKIGRLWGELVLFDNDVCTPKSFRCGRFKIVTSVMDPINTSLNLECKGRFYPIRVFEEQTPADVSTSCK
ncbi:hypothetical protein ACSBR1_027624 [Camellia fascicularis]